MAEEEKKVSKTKHPEPCSYDADMLTTASGKRIKVTDEEFAIMLEKAAGFKSRLAKQLGISTSAVCHRIQRSEYLREACKTIEDTVLDLAESKLLEAVKNGEAWAITFVLKCKGRKRGWIEKQDMVFGGEMEAPPPPFVIELHDTAYVEDERKRVEAEMAKTMEAMTIDVAAAYSGGGAESPETGPGAALDAPATAEGLQDASESGADRKPLDAPAEMPRATAMPQPTRVPRSPSEAAAMRREREAMERAAQGGCAPASPQGPSAAVPVAFPRR